jgi:uncharacterized protein (DUF2252 family)
MSRLVNGDMNRDIGAKLRAAKPPGWLSDWKRPADRDPLRVLDRAAAGRDRDLVDRRNKEMGKDAPTFLRGAAGVMADDLAKTVGDTTGIWLDICGDAHLGNFGMYGSPERTRVFDVTDFDEARPGPWEWDVCRLATSVVVTARDRGVDSKGENAAVTATVGAYCDAITALASGSLIGRWYVLARSKSLKHLDVAVSDEGASSDDVVRRAQGLLDGADDRKQGATVQELTEGGTFKPLPSDDDRSDQTPMASDEPEAESVRLAYESYVKTLPEAVRRMVQGYEVTAVAKRPVGEGSLGLRNYLLLLQGPDEKDALILQVKEATPSQLGFGLAPYPCVHEGERVVRMQRTLQAVSDPFLGWTSIDGQAFYVRQFRDRKGSPKLEVDKNGTADFVGDLVAFGRLCGVTLARAHARASDEAHGHLVQISAYLGTKAHEHKQFADGVVSFAHTYADVTKDDCQTLKRKSAAPNRASS